MKKKKMIIIVVISLIILLIVGVIVYYMNFTRKLVCTRVNEPYSNMQKTEKIIFSFDIMGKVKSLNIISQYKFDTNELASDQYNEFKKSLEPYGIQVSQKDDTILTNEYSNFDTYKNLKRKQILKKYKEFFYEC